MQGRKTGGKRLSVGRAGGSALPAGHAGDAGASCSLTSRVGRIAGHRVTHHLTGQLHLSTSGKRAEAFTHPPRCAQTMQALEPSVRKGKRHYEKSEKAVKRGKRSSYDSVPFRWIHRVHAVPIDSPAGCSWKLASWSASSRGVQRAEDARGDLRAHPGAGGPPTRREAHRAATDQGRRRHTRPKQNEPTNKGSGAFSGCCRTERPRTRTTQHHSTGT